MQIQKEFQLKIPFDQLHLSVSGFTARHESSAHGVMREEDVVLIVAMKVMYQVSGALASMYSEFKHKALTVFWLMSIFDRF